MKNKLKNTKDLIINIGHLGTKSEQITLIYEYLNSDNEKIYDFIMYVSNYNLRIKEQLKIINMYKEKNDENILEIATFLFQFKDINSILNLLKVYKYSSNKENTKELIENVNLLRRDTKEQLELIKLYDDIFKTEEYYFKILNQNKIKYSGKVSDDVYKMLSNSLLDTKLQKQSIKLYLKNNDFNIIKFNQEKRKSYTL